MPQVSDIELRRENQFPLHASIVPLSSCHSNFLISSSLLPFFISSTPASTFNFRQLCRQLERLHRPRLLAFSFRIFSCSVLIFLCSPSQFSLFSIFVLSCSVICSWFKSLKTYQRSGHPAIRYSVFWPPLRYPPLTSLGPYLTYIPSIYIPIVQIYFGGMY